MDECPIANTILPLPGNRRAWEVFVLCQSQFETNGFGHMRLDWNVLLTVLVEGYGIKGELLIEELDKLAILEATYKGIIEELMKLRESEQQAQRDFEAHVQHLRP